MPQEVFSVGTVPQRGMTRDELMAAINQTLPTSPSALGQIEQLAAPGLVKAVSTVDGAKVFSTVSGAELATAIETNHTLVTNGAIDLTVRTTILDAAAGAKTLTLGNGTYDGQEHWILMKSSASTATWTASGLLNLFGLSGFVLDAVGYSLGLKWNAAAGKWQFMGGNATLTP